MEAVRKASQEYLEGQQDLQTRIASHLWAYNEIGELVPQTLVNVMSGHYFPYSESYYELENSYQLCLEGFYTYAFAALRSVLELGILGVYFAVNDKEHEDVLPWITSKERTPRFKKILHKLNTLDKVRKFDERFGLAKRIAKTYDNLSGYVHTRGYRYSSTAQARSNSNQFSEPALKRYCEAMFPVVRDVIITMLLKYPIGMQPLPLSKKFGLNGPAGGFLEDDQVKNVTYVLESKEKAFLKTLSDEDPNVRQTVEYFESLPDLPDEQWQQQIQELDKQFPNLEEQ
ncbi:MAG: hypothetical protein HY687_02725 [Chloroflexi bacterium]|nr:hypothetical protein [Chloroflexota bacterium]